MLSVYSFILQGASLGLTASVSPGPLLLLLISQSISGGWKRGAIVALAPLVSDAPLIIVILFLLKQVPLLYLNLISIVGGIYIIYLAWRLFQKWRVVQVSGSEIPSNYHNNLGQAILVNYLNPGPYMFWTLVNGPLLLQAFRLSILHGIGFIISFYGLFIGTMLVMAGIFSQAKKIGPRFVHILSLASVIILSAFGFILLYRGFSSLITNGNPINISY